MQLYFLLDLLLLLCGLQQNPFYSQRSCQLGFLFGISLGVGKVNERKATFGDFFFQNVFGVIELHRLLVQKTQHLLKERRKGGRKEGIHWRKGVGRKGGREEGRKEGSKAARKEARKQARDSMKEGGKEGTYKGRKEGDEGSPESSEAREGGEGGARMNIPG
jgi:hypothetical protein